MKLLTTCCVPSYWGTIVSLCNPMQVLKVNWNLTMEEQRKGAEEKNRRGAK